MNHRSLEVFTKVDIFLVSTYMFWCIWEKSYWYSYNYCYSFGHITLRRFQLYIMYYNSKPIWIMDLEVGKHYFSRLNQSSEYFWPYGFYWNDALFWVMCSIGGLWQPEKRLQPWSAGLYNTTTFWYLTFSRSFFSIVLLFIRKQLILTWGHPAVSDKIFQNGIHWSPILNSWICAL